MLTSILQAQFSQLHSPFTFSQLLPTKQTCTKSCCILLSFPLVFHLLFPLTDMHISVLFFPQQFCLQTGAVLVLPVLLNIKLQASCGMESPLPSCVSQQISGVLSCCNRARCWSIPASLIDVFSCIQGDVSSSLHNSLWLFAVEKGLRLLLWCLPGLHYFSRATENDYRAYLTVWGTACLVLLVTASPL